jgi:hypothetical protein
MHMPEKVKVLVKKQEPDYEPPLGLPEGALLTRLEKNDLSFSLSLMLVSCVFGGGVSGSSDRLAWRSWNEVSIY